MLSLFPEGLEEVENDGDIELAGYGNAAAERRARAVFPALEVRAVEAGWEERWREFHTPVVVGPLWIGPPWAAAPPELTPVVIDPGRAFGTGAHATTRLCLDFLADLPRGSLVDVGCGSGVIAVAASKFGFRPVIAVDSDPAAVEAAERNVAANGVDVDVRHADALVDKLPSTEIAVANITLDAVLAVAARLAVARFVASGYLRSDRPQAPGLRHHERRTDGHWAADLFVRA
jgi:ribosomal protein L11 methyltransferase